MPRRTRVIVLNSDPEYAPVIRADLRSIEGVRIVVEVSDPSRLCNIIDELPAEVLLVNLDTDPQGLLSLVRTVADRYPQLSIFGVSGSDDSRLILEALRAGMREFVVKPIDRGQLAESLARAATSKDADGRHGKLICTLGAAGGVGCTTIATNLACELSRLGKQGTVLVDLHLLCGHVAAFLDICPRFNMANLCATDEAVDHNMVEQALVKHDSGLYVLAGPDHLGQSSPVTLRKCAAVLNLLTESFDYVVCDGPALTDPYRNVILDLADTVLLVVQLLVTSLRNAAQLIRALESDGYHLDRLQIIVNRCVKENGTLTAGDVEEVLGRDVFHTVPSDWKAVSSAVNTGRPLSLACPRSKVRESIRELALRIHDPDACRQTAGGNGGHGKVGLFARVLGL